MKVLKKVAITAVTAACNFAYLPANAADQSDMQFSLIVNESSPEASAFIPTKEMLREFAVKREKGVRPNFSDNPFLEVDWSIDMSIEPTDEELISNITL